MRVRAARGDPRGAAAGPPAPRAESCGVRNRGGPTRRRLLHQSGVEVHAGSGSVAPQDPLGLGLVVGGHLRGRGRTTFGQTQRVQERSEGALQPRRRPLREFLGVTQCPGDHLRLVRGRERVEARIAGAHVVRGMRDEAQLQTQPPGTRLVRRPDEECGEIGGPLTPGDALGDLTVHVRTPPERARPRAPVAPLPAPARSPPAPAPPRTARPARVRHGRGSAAGTARRARAARAAPRRCSRRRRDRRPGSRPQRSRRCPRPAGSAARARAPASCPAAQMSGERSRERGLQREQHVTLGDGRELEPPQRAKHLLIQRASTHVRLLTSRLRTSRPPHREGRAHRRETPGPGRKCPGPREPL